MDQKIRSIEKLLFVPYQRHTAFNGQISIGVGLRFCAREFSPSGDKPPPAGAACSIGLLNAHIQKAADFVFRYAPTWGVFLLFKYLTEHSGYAQIHFAAVGRMDATAAQFLAAHLRRYS